MKWDTVVFRLTRHHDNVESAMLESVPNYDGDYENSLRRRYLPFTGHGKPHGELLAVLREDGWEPFAIERGEGVDGEPDADWTNRWFKRPADPPLPPLDEDGWPVDQ